MAERQPQKPQKRPGAYSSPGQFPGRTKLDKWLDERIGKTVTLRLRIGVSEGIDHPDYVDLKIKAVDRYAIFGTLMEFEHQHDLWISKENIVAIWMTIK